MYRIFTQTTLDLLYFCKSVSFFLIYYLCEFQHCYLSQFPVSLDNFHAYIIIITIFI